MQIAKSGLVMSLERGKILYENSDYEVSLSLYEKMLVDFPDGKENDWVMYRMAMTYEDLGKMEEAGKTYESLHSKYGSTYWGEQAAWRLKNNKWNKDYGEKAKEIGERHEREQN